MAFHHGNDWEKKQKRYSGAQLLFDHLIERLMESDRELYFHFPVTDDIAPEYSNIIKNPMDLSTMREKNGRNEYATVRQVIDDGKLIANNAMTYNAEYTVFHMAAQKLSEAVDHYTSHSFLTECSQSLPFASTVNWSGIGLKSEEKEKEKEKKMKTEEPELSVEDILKSVNKAREKLAPRMSNAPKLAFIDDKSGKLVLNVLGEEKENSTPKLINLNDKIGEGTRGVCAPSDNKVIRDPISYSDYGIFRNTAPHLDSTWARMSFPIRYHRLLMSHVLSSTRLKTQSDLLLRTYGNRQLASDALSATSFAQNTGSVSGILNNLLNNATDGEHAWAQKVFNKWNMERLGDKEIADMDSHLGEINSLSNLGIDAPWIGDVLMQMNRKNEAAAQLEPIVTAVNMPRLSVSQPGSSLRHPSQHELESSARFDATQTVGNMPRLAQPNTFARHPSHHLIDSSAQLDSSMTDNMPRLSSSQPITFSRHHSQHDMESSTRLDETVTAVSTQRFSTMQSTAFTRHQSERVMDYSVRIANNVAAVSMQRHSSSHVIAMSHHPSEHVLLETHAQSSQQIGMVDGEMQNAPALDIAMGDEVDMDLMNEFFV